MLYRAGKFHQLLSLAKSLISVIFFFCVNDYILKDMVTSTAMIKKTDGYINSYLVNKLALYRWIIIA